MDHILIADDEGPKLASLTEFVQTLASHLPVESSRSVRATINAMRRNLPRFLVLDMSLPTFDIAPGEPGGRPQGFGGSEVLRYMDYHELVCPVIVVTQYEAFSDDHRNVDLSAIKKELAEEHAHNFRGLVYYSSLKDEWKPKLAVLVNEILGGKA
jgi:CheY-like chemotaxis protein